ncbi:MAG: putative transcriptional regulator [Solirubrobacterales bacterium]|jgi:DNA-binding PadR family transcriptional regulator|nr:putative transcriptional regulator [Solirubrobacterales bacterium]
MALRHAVLTALLEGEASGYQLSKRFDVSVAGFWSATPQQLYRELERLEEEGLLRARLIEQRRRPNKRAFTITAAGRRQLHEFTAQPTRPAALRDDLLVKVQAVDVGDRDAVREALATRLEHAQGKLALYDRLHENMLEGRTEDDYLRDAERIGPYLTLMGGRLYEQLQIDWCEAVLDVLAARVRSDAAPRNQERGAGRTRRP